MKDTTHHPIPAHPGTDDGDTMRQSVKPATSAATQNRKIGKREKTAKAISKADRLDFKKAFERWKQHHYRK